MITLDYVAKTLQVPAEELWRQSLQAYVLRERRLAQLDIADIQERYGVTSVDELTQRIEAGAIYSHPAWEDMIEWENLRAHLQRLDQLTPQVLVG
ncbi:MAG: hypothetical protein QG637_1729 [Chloroflexota bacterium]|nr:hypothetical protein [Chloroflexota bacterium]